MALQHGAAHWWGQWLLVTPHFGLTLQCVGPSAHIPPLGRNGFWFSAAALSHLCEMQVLEPVKYNPGFYTLLRGL